MIDDQRVLLETIGKVETKLASLETEIHNPTLGAMEFADNQPDIDRLREESSMLRSLLQTLQGTSHAPTRINCIGTHGAS
jgi:hypothetical protein